MRKGQTQVEKQFTEDMKRAHSMIDEILEIIRAEYPEFSDIHITAADNGYAEIRVVKWAPMKEANEAYTKPRRHLMEHHRMPGREWEECDIDGQNRYLESVGRLLKEGEEHDRMAG